jgi:hypothetical protein
MPHIFISGKRRSRIPCLRIFPVGGALIAPPR